MPLLRKQPFEKTKAPAHLKPEDDVFHCEATNEVFTDYEMFFERTILCNSLVWSCSVTGKSGLTYEEAVESEQKAKKRISNLPKPVKKGVLWLTHHKTKKGRLSDLVDDVYDWIKNRYFVGEIVDAVIGNQWCESTVLRVIPPTEDEIKADMEEITEVEEDGSPKKEAGESSSSSPTLEERLKSPPDHLYKYEVEETCPDDEDIVEHHVVEADDVRRDKGILNREKLSLYLKNVVELDGGVMFKLKPKGIKIYNLDSLQWSEIYSGPEPHFEESLRKVPLMTNKKKGQFTLDGWATKGAKKPVGKEEKTEKEKKPKSEGTKKPKKQTPEEIEAEMKKLREAQARYREEVRQREEDAKKRRIEEKQKEKERKAEEKRLVKEIMQEWNSRREDLDCEDHKELPKPTPIRCRIPNPLLGDFLSLLEFLHSFSSILELKDNYPSGVSFHELESALVETESVDGGFYDIISFMLVSLFDLQLEEEEEAKAFTDNTATDELHEGLTGKNEEVATALKIATETQFYTKRNLGLQLREVHLDQWSITEVLRLHLESSGAFRGNNLQAWRSTQRGGWRLTDDPGFEFCRENPEIISSLKTMSVFELGVTEKLKILMAMMNQMLTFAGVRDELDTRIESYYEAKAELRQTQADENKRLTEINQERIKKRKEEREKEKEKKLIADENKDKKEVLAGGKTTRLQEKAIVAKEKEEQDKQQEKDKKREDFLAREADLLTTLSEYQRNVSVQCLGRDRAYRRFWLFDSVPGIFVEHDDDLIGDCREEPTPWDPDLLVAPLTEEQAMVKAREILEARGQSMPGSPSSDKENKIKAPGTISVGEVSKTYSKKTPVLKQKVLATSNGSLSVQEEPTVNGVSSSEEVKTEEMEVEEENKMEIPSSPPWGCCLANGPDCPVHSNILPRVHWAYYSSPQQIDQLLNSLNTRGVREGELRDKILAERELIDSKLKKCKEDHYVLTEEAADELGQKQLQDVQNKRQKQSKNSGNDPIPMGTSLLEMIELSLRDQILELEEKIFFGNLGKLKVSDRAEWVAAITNGSYKMDTPCLTWGDGEKLEADSQADIEMEKVQQLAAAILQVGQMILDHEKYLKQPLGEDEKERKKRLKKEEDAKKKKEEVEEDEEEDDEVEVKVVMTPFKRWEKSLMSSITMGQLFIHLTCLDNSIVWSKSIMNTKCKICRRKTDPDQLLLCDGCDNGYHMYCLKPKLKSIPSGDWYCPECKPKERVRSPKKKVRKSFSINDLESDEEDEESQSKKQKNSKNKKRAITEIEEDLKETTPPKRKGGRRKVIESEEEEEESEDEAPKSRGNKKGGLANLLGKRGAAKKAEKQMKGLDNSYREDKEDEEDEDEDKPSRRSRTRGNKSKEDNKENNRGKRGRNLDDSVELNLTGLENVLKALIKHKDGWPFDRPISKSEVPDYHLHVKHPMDLGTIKTRLNDMVYQKDQQVIDDIRLVFNNCYSYNMEDTEEYGCAERLEKYFETQLRSQGIAEEPVGANPRSKKRRF